MSSVTVVPGIGWLLLLLSRRCRRDVLRREVGRCARHAEFIRSAVHARKMPAEIVGRRRRGGGPFERRRVPGIVGRLLTLLQAPEEIDEEENLRKGRDERRDRDE